MEILFELFADTEGSSGGRAGNLMFSIQDQNNLRQRLSDENHVICIHYPEGSEFYGLCEGPGYENTGETGGSAELHTQRVQFHVHNKTARWHGHGGFCVEHMLPSCVKVPLLFAHSCRQVPCMWHPYLGFDILKLPDLYQ